MRTHQLPLFPWEQEPTILRALSVGGMERLGSATLEDAPGTMLCVRMPVGFSPSPLLQMNRP